jgi:hypothetical protein
LDKSNAENWVVQKIGAKKFWSNRVFGVYASILLHHTIEAACVVQMWGQIVRNCCSWSRG